jgi:hypothetical protein
VVNAEFIVPSCHVIYTQYTKLGVLFPHTMYACSVFKFGAYESSDDRADQTNSSFHKT